MGRRYISDKIVEWYSENSRPLPWRSTNDPYKIWLSEVILQQTRVVQGLPYYYNFVGKYPRVQDLAAAEEQEVLRVWQGLGYYTRARNLHKCAKTVAELHNGVFPSTFKELLSLPGIGAYTAAAIASFAFGERVPVVDGNVFRVLARIFGIETPINSPEGRKQFFDIADELVPPHAPGLHNQAIMEFGALFCKPRNPECPQCPFKTSCVAFRGGITEVLPVKTEKKKPRERYFYYLVVEKENSWLMQQRASKDIWHGLFDFLLIESQHPLPAATMMSDTPYREWFHGADERAFSKTYVHKLTHQTIHCRFVRVTPTDAFQPGERAKFYTEKEIEELPKPALISRFLSDQKTIS